MKDLERTETFTFNYSAIRKDDEVDTQAIEESLEMEFSQIEGASIEYTIYQFNKFLLALGYSQNNIERFLKLY